MNAAERRNEIISILIVWHHITTKNLADEFDVTVNSIKNDIHALSFAYPIYTKPGVAGGVFMEEHYNPHINSLTLKELETLKEVYEEAEDRYKEILVQILHKYGPDSRVDKRLQVLSQGFTDRGFFILQFPNKIIYNPYFLCPHPVNFLRLFY